MNPQESRHGLPRAKAESDGFLAREAAGVGLGPVAGAARQLRAWLRRRLHPEPVPRVMERTLPKHVLDAGLRREHGCIGLSSADTRPVLSGRES